uniref:Uncharacterized protein n=1 Tax=Mesocestoides corti TaxID=53468 RepID=A0A5K3G4R3_MESCO
MITGSLKVDFIILRHTTTTTTTTEKLNPRSDAPSAALTIHTTNHRQLTSASQAVCPPALKKLCPRLAFDSTSLAHFRKKKRKRKKKKYPLSLPLYSLIDGWHSCQHAVVVVANAFLLPFSIIDDCVCDTAIAFCLQNRIADLAHLHAFKSHFKSYLSLARLRIWTDQAHFCICSFT